MAEQELSLQTLDCESHSVKCASIGDEPLTARFEAQVHGEKPS